MRDQLIVGRSTDCCAREQSTSRQRDGPIAPIGQMRTTQRPPTLGTALLSA